MEKKSSTRKKEKIGENEEIKNLGCHKSVDHAETDSGDGLGNLRRFL